MASYFEEFDSLVNGQGLTPPKRGKTLDMQKLQQEFEKAQAQTAVQQQAEGGGLFDTLGGVAKGGIGQGLQSTGRGLQSILGENSFTNALQGTGEILQEQGQELLSPSQIRGRQEIAGSNNPASAAINIVRNPGAVAGMAGEEILAETGGIAGGFGGAAIGSRYLTPSVQRFIDKYALPGAQAAGKALQLAPNPLAKGVGKLIDKAATALEKRNAARNVARTVGGAAGVGVGGFPSNLGESIQQIEEEFADVAPDEFKGTPYYDSLIEDGLSPDDAKKETVERIADSGGLYAALGSSALEMLFGASILKNWGKSGSRLKKATETAAAGAVTEFAQETGQSAFSQSLAGDITGMDVDWNRAATQGVIGSAIGGTIGGVFGSLSPGGPIARAADSGTDRVARELDTGMDWDLIRPRALRDVEREPGAVGDLPPPNRPGGPSDSGGGPTNRRESTDPNWTEGNPGMGPIQTRTFEGEVQEGNRNPPGAPRKGNTYENEPTPEPGQIEEQKKLGTDNVIYGEGPTEPGGTPKRTPATDAKKRRLELREEQEKREAERKAAEKKGRLETMLGDDFEVRTKSGGTFKTEGAARNRLRQLKAEDQYDIVKEKDGFIARKKANIPADKKADMPAQQTPAEPVKPAAPAVPAVDKKADMPAEQPRFRENGVTLRNSKRQSYKTKAGAEKFLNAMPEDMRKEYAVAEEDGGFVLKQLETDADIKKGFVYNDKKYAEKVLKDLSLKRGSNDLEVVAVKGGFAIEKKAKAKPAKAPATYEEAETEIRGIADSIGGDFGEALQKAVDVEPDDSPVYNKIQRLLNTTADKPEAQVAALREIQEDLENSPEADPEYLLDEMLKRAGGQQSQKTIRQGDGDKYFDDGAQKMADSVHGSYKSRMFKTYMSPDQFLAMSDRLTDGPSKRKLDPIEKHLESGGQLNSVPELWFDNDGGGKAHVTGHEGRHRAHALKKRGVKLMPVVMHSNGSPGGAIRQNTQKPGSFDYIDPENWPKSLRGQALNDQNIMRFPLTRDEKTGNVSWTGGDQNAMDIGHFTLNWLEDLDIPVSENGKAWEETVAALDDPDVATIMDVDIVQMEDWQRTEVANALADLKAMGFPVEAALDLDALVMYDTDTFMTGVYNNSYGGTVGVHEQTIYNAALQGGANQERARKYLRWTLAHELAHRLDNSLGGFAFEDGPRKQVAFYLTESSPLFRKGGSISKEVEAAAEADDTLGAILQYPLDATQFPMSAEDRGKEIFAQLVALRMTTGDTYLEYLGDAFALIDEVISNAEAAKTDTVAAGKVREAVRPLSPDGRPLLSRPNGRGRKGPGGQQANRTVPQSGTDPSEKSERSDGPADTEAEEASTYANGIKRRLREKLGKRKSLVDKFEAVSNTIEGAVLSPYQGLRPSQHIRKAVDRMVDYALEGITARFWYEDSGDEVMRIMRGDREMAVRFTTVESIYSPQSSVQSNTMFAIKAWNRHAAGQPVFKGTHLATFREEVKATRATRSGAVDYAKRHRYTKKAGYNIRQNDNGSWDIFLDPELVSEQELTNLRRGLTKDEAGRLTVAEVNGEYRIYRADRDHDIIKDRAKDLAAHLVLTEGAHLSGRKRDNFYKNLMRNVDPSLVQGVTIDLWMSRVFGFKSDSVSDPRKYDIVEDVVHEVAEALGWEPQQVQAAVWTAWKTRTEKVKHKAKKAALEAGIGRKEGKKYVVEPHEMDDYLEVLHQHAIDAEITPEELDLAGRSFQDFIEMNLASFAMESVPSTKIPHLAGMTAAQKKKHMRLVQQAMKDENGKDILMEALGLAAYNEPLGSRGWWEGSISPMAIYRAASVRAKGADADDATLDPDSRALMDAYAAALGIVNFQDGMAWQRMHPTKTKSKQNSVLFESSRPLTNKEFDRLNRAVYSRWGDHAWVTHGATGDIVINTYAPYNDMKDFHKDLVWEFNRALPDDLTYQIYGHGFDGELHLNSWKDQPNGEGYIRGINALKSPDLYRGLLRVLSQKARLERDFAKAEGLHFDQGLYDRVEAAVQREIDSGTLYSKSLAAPERKNPIDQDVARRVAQRFLNRFGKGRRNFKIKLATWGDRPDPARGQYDPKTRTVTIYTDQVSNAAEMEAVIRHELIGHHGLRNLLNPAEFQQLLLQVLNSKDPKVQAVLAQLRQSPGYRHASDLVLAEEAIAMLAEKDPKHSLVKRIMRAIRQLMDKAGITKPSDNITQDDLIDILHQSAKAMKRQRYRRLKGQPGTVMNMVAWHGSPHKFGKFDLNKIGTGEGFQAYGWGLYFAEKQSVAKDYHKNLSRRLGDPDAGRPYTKWNVAGYELTKEELDLLARDETNNPPSEAQLDIMWWGVAQRFLGDDTAPQEVVERLGERLAALYADGGLLYNLQQQNYDRLADLIDYQFTKDKGHLDIALDTFKRQMKKGAYDDLLKRHTSGLLSRLVAEAEELEGPDWDILTLSANGLSDQFFRAIQAAADDPDLDDFVTVRERNALRNVAITGRVHSFGIDMMERVYHFPTTIEGQAIDDNPGMVFKVDLPEDDWILNQELPISEQPERVQQAVLAAMKEAVFAFGNAPGAQRQPKEILAMKGKAVVHFIQDSQRSAKRASLLLKKHGLKGSKYYDGMSRGKPGALRSITIDGETLPVNAHIEWRGYPPHVHEVYEQVIIYDGDIERTRKLFEQQLITAETQPAENYDKGIVEYWKNVLSLLDKTSTKRYKATHNYVIWDDEAIDILEAFEGGLFSRELPDNVWDAINRNMAKGDSDLTLWERIKKWIEENIDLKWDRIAYNVFDQFHYLRKLEEAVNGGKVMDASRSAWKAALASKSPETVMQVLLFKGGLELRNGNVGIRQGTKGFLEHIAPIAELGPEYVALWESWMAAQRAQRLAREGRENNWNQADMQEIMRHVDANPAIKAEFEKAQRGWREFNEQLLDFSEQAGLVSAEQRRKWAKDDYVPFYRTMEDGFVASPDAKGGAGLADASSNIYQLSGKDGKTAPIIENMVKMATATVDNAFRNIAMQRVVEVAEMAGDPVLKRVKQESKQTKERLIREMMVEALRANPQLRNDPDFLADLARGRDSSFAQPREGEVDVTWDPRHPPKDVVSVLVNGERRWYKVNDPDILNAVVGIGPRRWGWFMEALRLPKNVLTKMITADPGFLMANIVRDTMSSFVVMDRGKLSPGAAFMDAAYGFMASHIKNDEMWELMASGRGFSEYYSAANADVRRMVKGKKKRAGKDWLDEAGWWQKWQQVASRFEQANRLGMRKRILEEGGTEAEANFKAQDLLNFSMRGGNTAVQILTELVPFLNARIQGLGVLGRGYKTSRTAFMQKGAMITVATMALLAMNWDDERYKSLPEEDKDMNWHFWIGDEHLRLPKPFEVGLIFGTTWERTMTAMMGDEDHRKLAERALFAITQTLAFNPIPQAVNPLIEQWMNYDQFQDRPIVGLKHQGKLPETQYDEYTSLTSRAIGGAAGISPVRMDHFLESYFGTIGRYAMMMTDGVFAQMGWFPERPTWSGSDYPVASRFYRTGRTSTKYSGNFYEYMDEVRKISGSINQARKEGNMPLAKALMEEHRDKLRMKARLNAANNQIRNLNNQILRVLEGTDDPDVKQEKMQALKERRREVFSRAAKTVEEAF